MIKLFEVSHTLLQDNNPNDQTQTILFRLNSLSSGAYNSVDFQLIQINTVPLSMF